MEVIVWLGGWRQGQQYWSYLEMEILPYERDSVWIWERRMKGDVLETYKILTELERLGKMFHVTEAHSISQYDQDVSSISIPYSLNPIRLNQIEWQSRFEETKHLLLLHFLCFCSKKGKHLIESQRDWRKLVGKREDVKVFKIQDMNLNRTLHWKSLMIGVIAKENTGNTVMTAEVDPSCDGRWNGWKALSKQTSRLVQPRQS